MAMKWDAVAPFIRSLTRRDDYVPAPVPSAPAKASPAVMQQLADFDRELGGLTVETHAGLLLTLGVQWERMHRSRYDEGDDGGFDCEIVPIGTVHEMDICARLDNGAIHCPYNCQEYYAKEAHDARSWILKEIAKEEIYRRRNARAWFACQGLAEDFDEVCRHLEVTPLPDVSDDLSSFIITESITGRRHDDGSWGLAIENEARGFQLYQWLGARQMRVHLHGSSIDYRQRDSLAAYALALPVVMEWEGLEGPIQLRARDTAWAAVQKEPWIDNGFTIPESFYGADPDELIDRTRVHIVTPIGSGSLSADDPASTPVPTLLAQLGLG